MQKKDNTAQHKRKITQGRSKIGGHNNEESNTKDTRLTYLQVEQLSAQFAVYLEEHSQESIDALLILLDEAQKNTTVSVISYLKTALYASSFDSEESQTRYIENIKAKFLTPSGKGGSR